MIIYDDDDDDDVCTQDKCRVAGDVGCNTGHVAGSREV